MKFPYGPEEIDYLKSRDRCLGEIIDLIGPVERDVEPDLFRALVCNIASQQISGKAAETVIARLETALGAIAPAAVLAAPCETLRAAGLSQRKTAFVKALAEKTSSGAFDLERVAALPDSEAVSALVSLDGVGVWTAEMLLLFSLCRPDVLSFGDFGIQRGMRMVYRHRKITQTLFARYRRRLSPCGSVASLYFWAVAGGAVPGLSDPAK